MVSVVILYLCDVHGLVLLHVWSPAAGMQWCSGADEGLMGSGSVGVCRSPSCQTGSPLYWIPSADRWHSSLPSAGHQRSLSGSPELSCKQIFNTSTVAESGFDLRARDGWHSLEEPAGVSTEEAVIFSNGDAAQSHECPLHRGQVLPWPQQQVHDD